MTETINLDSGHREVVRGIAKDSSVLCSITSAPDVYIHVITAKDTAELFKGDGTVIPNDDAHAVSCLSKEPGRRPVFSDGRCHRLACQSGCKVRYADHGL
jgi:hypothetical protein